MMIKSNKCCCEKTDKSACEKENNTVCMVCGKQGTLVKNITVKHMILDELIEQVDENDYYLCMSEECDIAYYNTEKKLMFNKQQIKVPIWFKNDANPKFTCYCSEVTEEKVLNAVIEEGATNMKDVLKITGAMSKPQCQKKNPLGICCHQIIQNAIEKGLSLKGENK